MEDNNFQAARGVCSDTKSPLRILKLALLHRIVHVVTCTHVSATLGHAVSKLLCRISARMLCLLQLLCSSLNLGWLYMTA